MADIICVGDFEYRRKDLIGHGAFAVVFKGRHRDVRMQIYRENLVTLDHRLNKLMYMYFRFAVFSPVNWEMLTVNSLKDIYIVSYHAKYI